MNTDRVVEVRADPGDVARRVDVLRALGDETRLRIVDLLQDRDLSPAALGETLDLAGSLLAHHLNALAAAGVVCRVHSGNDRRRTYVRLVPESLSGLLPGATGFHAPRILFVCTHNSARSVMAEAVWRAVSKVPAASAGTDPASRVHARARAALQAHGLATPAGAPRHVREVIRPDDVIVSVCDAVNERFDAFPRRHLHWSIADPARLDTDEAFTSALVDIRRRVEHMAPHVSRARRSAQAWR